MILKRALTRTAARYRLRERSAFEGTTEDPELEQGAPDLSEFIHE